MLKVDALETSLKTQAASATRATEKAREQITELTAAKSVAEAAVATLTASALTLSEGKAAAEALAAGLRESAATLTAQLEASRGMAVDTLGLITWLHGVGVGAGSTDLPWDAASTEGRLGAAILKMLVDARADKKPARGAKSAE